jgi:hypothetical protein
MTGGFSSASRTLRAHEAAYSARSRRSRACTAFGAPRQRLDEKSTPGVRAQTIARGLRGAIAIACARAARTARLPAAA